MTDITLITHPNLHHSPRNLRLKPQAMPGGSRVSSVSLGLRALFAFVSLLIRFVTAEQATRILSFVAANRQRNFFTTGWRPVAFIVLVAYIGYGSDLIDDSTTMGWVDDLAIVLFMTYVVGWAGLTFADQFRNARLRANEAVAGAARETVETATDWPPDLMANVSIPNEYM